MASGRGYSRCGLWMVWSLEDTGVWLHGIWVGLDGHALYR